MKCEHIIEHLEDYLDGFLSKRDTAKYQQHLKDCADCQSLKKKIFKVQAKYKFRVTAPYSLLPECT
jgi:predicted anti-sigma-YlaC factor YlaD